MNVNEREARIQQAFMDPIQQRVFQMFIHIGRERSLPKLLEACKSADVSVSEATLKRWSSKFKWTDLALRTDSEISNRIVDAAMPLHVNGMQRDLEIIDKLKETFYKNVDAGLITVNLADYVMLLKTQALITGDPTARTEHTETHKHSVTVQLTEEQLADMMRFDAAHKHSLPMMLESETYESE